MAEVAEKHPHARSQSSQLSASPQRIVIGALVVFVLCLMLSSVRVLVEAPISGYETDVNHARRRSDERFAGIKAALPQRGVVGYVGDSPGTFADYYLTQYALAPLVVDYSADHPLVVGNFPKGAQDAARRTVARNLELIRDFGDGVLLFANKGAR